MTADVIVAGPLDSDCNCEYPPSPPFLLLHFLLLFFHLPLSKRKNFSPLSPVMFKPFMLLCGRVGRVHNEVSTRDQRNERKDAHWLENWLEWAKISKDRARSCSLLGRREKYIYMIETALYEGLYWLDKQKTCQGNVIVGFVIFFTFLATSTSALPWILLFPLCLFFNSIYSSISTVSPDAIKHVLFRSVSMLVILFAVQLHARDYLQCTNEDSKAKNHPASQ